MKIERGQPLVWGEEIKSKTIFSQWLSLFEFFFLGKAIGFLVHHLIERGSYQTSLERWKWFFPFPISLQPIIFKVQFCRRQTCNPLANAMTEITSVVIVVDFYWSESVNECMYIMIFHDLSWNATRTKKFLYRDVLMNYLNSCFQWRRPFKFSPRERPQIYFFISFILPKPYKWSSPKLKLPVFCLSSVPMVQHICLGEPISKHPVY